MTLPVFFGFKYIKTSFRKLTVIIKKVAEDENL